MLFHEVQKNSRKRRKTVHETSNDSSDEEDDDDDEEDEDPKPAPTPRWVLDSVLTAVSVGLKLIPTSFRASF